MLLVDGVALHCRSIVVDGVGRVGEEGGDFRALGYAQSDEGEDTQLGGQRTVFVGRHLIVGPQQFCEVIDEIQIGLPLSRCQCAVERNGGSINELLFTNELSKRFKTSTLRFGLNEWYYHIDYTSNTTMYDQSVPDDGSYAICLYDSNLRSSYFYDFNKNASEFYRGHENKLAFYVTHEWNNTPMRQQNSVNYQNDFALGTWGPLALCNGKTYHLHIFVDNCSVEAFVDGGCIAMTNLVFPTKPYNNLRFYSVGGQASFMNVKVYKLGM